MSVASPLTGRTAVVTGAARGLGADMAQALVRRGARVALLGLEEGELARTAAELPEGAAHWWAVDVSDADAMEEKAARVRSRFGSPSVVIGNAGIAESGTFLDSDPRLWRRVVEVNLVGSAVTARAFLPDLLRTRGYYLQVSSLAALAPAPLMSAYCSSKSGAESFAQVLRTEVAHRGVGVGVAYLSWADTDMIRAGDTTTALRALRSALPWPASRAYPAPEVAERLVRGVERRSAAVHAQQWVRGVRLARPLLPPLVALRSRRMMRHLEKDGGVAATGPLGEGGEAAVDATAAVPTSDTRS
ncbi:SDR family oxidoreductase [Streptomyces sp. NBC_01754]|uniref:SDR family oxidoreductase n=1 Tax=Streptomyces sp. NBC_01754 TaxID=2975930 RepID=UPI002DD8CE00|nr:SDR family oxidoreductase [Streptomyces sp. NBC_01754]WSC95809.1 SDR family oxidoreductase [Streptomyces sp. NBC_01754]